MDLPSQYFSTKGPSPTAFTPEPVRRRVAGMKQVLLMIAVVVCGSVLAAPKEPLFLKILNTEIRPIATDNSVKWDYDIVYVRAPRAGDEVHKRFYTDFSAPITMEPGADLMLLRPDGSEELLVKGGRWEYYRSSSFAGWKVGFLCKDL